MGDTSKIEWTDATWNPLVGCTKLSPGCDHCYAKTMHERFNGPGSFDTVQLAPHRLEQPLTWRKPRRVFVNSMSDLFHTDVSDEYIADVFAIMALAPQHTFQLLTKRHARMRALLSDVDFRDEVSGHIVDWTMETRRAGSGYMALANTYGDWWPLQNVHLGVSVEDQKWADTRIPALLDTPAAVRWLSCEPLLGPIDARLFLDPARGVQSWGRAIDWVVVGGESGRGARPMHPDWARRLRDQCAAAGVPFLFKQWGEWQDGSAGPGQHGEDHIIVADGRHEPAIRHQSRDLPYTDLARDRLTHRPGAHRAVFISRVGKKAAGRELDGVTHDGYPA